MAESQKRKIIIVASSINMDGPQNEKKQISTQILKKGKRKQARVPNPPIYRPPQRQEPGLCQCAQLEESSLSE